VKDCKEEEQQQQHAENHISILYYNRNYYGMLYLQG